MSAYQKNELTNEYLMLSSDRYAANELNAKLSVSRI